ncbi:hypothetical protein N0V90_005200 [Kalmusia sp. IMI 367209]|nr:hypothetical protein N0V90_005200 [Kalmusia sp. IMI 367209]
MRIVQWSSAIAALAAACPVEFNKELPPSLVSGATLNSCKHSDPRQALHQQSASCKRPYDLESFEYQSTEGTPFETWDAKLQKIGILFPDLRLDLFLALLAQFPTEFVPDVLIRLASLSQSTLAGGQLWKAVTFPTWLKKALIAIQEDGHQQSRNILIQHGLLQKSVEGSLVGIRMHKDIRSHFKTLKNVEPQPRWQLLIVVAACMQLGDETDGAISHKQLVKYFPDMDHETLEQLDLRDDEMANVLNQISRTYQNAYLFRESESFAIQAVEWSKRAFAPGDLQIVDCLEALAAAQRMRGKDWESENLQLYVVQTRQSILGDAHPDTLQAMQYLSHSYFWWNDWSKACDLRSQMVAINQNTHGESDHRTLSSMSGLAMLHYKTGQFVQAQNVQERLISLLQTKYGDEEEITQESIARLATFHREQGHYETAQELQAKIVAIQERTLGIEHERTLRNTAELAALHRSQNHFEVAQKFQIQLATILENTLGKTEETALSHMADLAVTYALGGKSNEAQELLVDIIKISTGAEIADPKSSVPAIKKLTNRYLHEFRSEEAEVLLVQTKQATKSLFGEGFESEPEDTGLLAQIYMDQKRWKEAEDLLIDAWEGRDQSSNDHDEFLFHVGIPLHTLYVSHGLQNKAKIGILELVILRLLGHPDHDQVQSNFNNVKLMAELADIYMSQRRWKDAGEMLEPLVENRQRRFGIDDGRTLICGPLQLEKIAYLIKNSYKMLEVREG